jgi:hypothetical protein
VPEAVDILAAALAGEEQTCVWTQDDLDDLWATTCGQAWTFIDGGPEDNHVRFCHGCGKKVVAIPVEAEVEPEEDEE